MATRLGRYTDLSQELIRGLPRFSAFHQHFHYTVDNWLPWYWNGFQQTTRYTYVIENLFNLDHVWDGLSSNIKGDVRKAQKHVEVEVAASPGEFFELNEMVFRRQGITAPYSRGFVERLDEACSTRGQRAIFIARDSKGNAHAGCYIVWDEQSAFYLMGGGDPELRRSGATSLCMWTAIQFAATVTKRFDFEGSMLRPVERYFRAFGAIPKPYSAVSKSNVLTAGMFLRRAFARLKRRLPGRVGQ